MNLKTGITILAGFLSLVAITLATTVLIESKVVAHATEPRLSNATMVVQVNTGFHGSIWRFRDGHRTCYFNSSGGIWCTP